MKKIIYFLLILCCCVFIGCGQNDYMVGQWQLVKYEYTDTQNQYVYTTQQIADLVDKYETSNYQPTSLQERIEKSLTSLYQYSADVIYEFTNKNEVNIKKDNQTTMSYVWSRNDNIVLLTYETLEMEWTLNEEGHCYTTTVFENGYLTAYYHKI